MDISRYCLNRVVMLALGLIIFLSDAGITQTISDCSPKSREVLTQLAVNDPLSQVRAAASEALSEVLFLSDVTEEELQDLATQGQTAELRQAAIKPLSVHFTQANLSLREMINVASQDPSIEVRKAIVPSLSVAWTKTIFSDADISNLLLFAKDGVSPEVQMAAADAIFASLTQFSSLKIRQFPEVAAGETVTVNMTKPIRVTFELDGQIPAVQASAGRHLRKLFIVVPQLLLDNPIEDLTTLINSETTSVVKEAASLALGHFLNRSDRSLDDLKQMAVEEETHEMRLAGGEAVSLRLLSEIKNGVVLFEDVMELITTAESQELADAMAIPLSRYYLCRTNFLI